MDLRDFASVYGILALQLRSKDTDQATIRAYFEAMKELPIDAVQKSAAAFAREDGRKFFPTTAEWASNARKAITDSFRQQLEAHREEPWRFDCERCDDTGWSIHDCAGDDFCGRRHVHAAHTFAKVCPCRPTNRTYQRHHTVGAGPVA